jgi:hypothetical protein
MTINIWGKYRDKVEKIDSTTSQRDARYLVGEYRMAYGQEWIVWAGRKCDDPTKG